MNPVRKALGEKLPGVRRRTGQTHCAKPLDTHTPPHGRVAPQRNIASPPQSSPPGPGESPHDTGEPVTLNRSLKRDTNSIRRNWAGNPARILPPNVMYPNRDTPTEPPESPGRNVVPERLEPKPRGMAESSTVLGHTTSKGMTRLSAWLPRPEYQCEKA